MAAGWLFLRKWRPSRRLAALGVGGSAVFPSRAVKSPLCLGLGGTIAGDRCSIASLSPAIDENCPLLNAPRPIRARTSIQLKVAERDGRCLMMPGDHAHHAHQPRQ